jgi:hypothetical protein
MGRCCHGGRELPPNTCNSGECKGDRGSEEIATTSGQRKPERWSRNDIRCEGCASAFERIWDVVDDSRNYIRREGIPKEDDVASAEGQRLAMTSAGG